MEPPPFLMAEAADLLKASSLTILQQARIPILVASKRDWKWYDPFVDGISLINNPFGGDSPFTEPRMILIARIRDVDTLESTLQPFSSSPLQLLQTPEVSL